MLLGLDHVNLRTPHLERTTRFYCDVLGMTTGPRPAFSFNGAWLYCGDRPVLHLVEIADLPRPSGELRLEHFAFTGRGLGELVERLRALGIEHRVALLPTYGTRQVSLRDPDGNRLHVDFSVEEPLP